VIVTQELSQNEDSGSSTDEYELDDVDDGEHEIVTVSSSTALATVATASCDVCLNAPPVKIVDMQVFVRNVSTSSKCIQNTRELLDVCWIV